MSVKYLIAKTFFISAGVMSFGGAYGAIEFPETPLIVTTSEKPNMMVLFDTSSSMRHIVPESNGDGTDSKYFAGTEASPSTYAPFNGCSNDDNKLPTGATYQLALVRVDDDGDAAEAVINAPGIRRHYRWGEYNVDPVGTPDDDLPWWREPVDIENYDDGERRCFDPDETYSAVLPISNQLPLGAIDTATYQGRFLNWYFCHLGVSNNCTTSSGVNNPRTMVRTDVLNYNDSLSPGDPGYSIEYSLWTRANARDRLQVSQKSMFDFVNSINGVNLGVASYGFEDRDCLRTGGAGCERREYTFGDALDDLDDDDPVPSSINSTSRIMEPLADIDVGDHRENVAATINNLAPDGFTPLAGATGAIGRYFVEGYEETVSVDDDGVSAYGDAVPVTTMFPQEPLYRDSSDKPIGADGKVIKSYCQSNYLITLTDGEPSQGQVISKNLREYTTSSSATAIGVTDDGFISGTTEAWQNALRGLYEMDLRPDLPEQQSVISYIVGFGDGIGVVSDTQFRNAAKYAGPHDPDPNAVYPSDDYPDRYFKALDEDTLTESLNSIAERIYRGSGSLASLAFETTALSTGQAVFQGKFHSGEWTGSLVANAITDVYPFDISPVWEARGKLDSLVVAGDEADNTNARNIFTYNGERGIPFQWDYVRNTGAGVPSGSFIGDDLAQSSAVLISNAEDDTAAAIHALARAAAIAAGTAVPAVPEYRNFSGKEALEFLRGDRSKQGVVGNSFRVRDLVSDDHTNVTGEGGLLGDIVNSAPVFVGPPVNYSDPNRTPMVYVGANDGMLHGFNARIDDPINGGKELLAYIPSMLASTEANKGLHYLSEQGYAHRDYVDLTPTVAEVELSTPGNWKTVLVGGLRAGGKGYYALNISNPDNFYESTALADRDLSESNAQTVVLWEFSGTSDTDMGYSFAKPVITKLANGKWAAITGNGYNSTDGKAALFIIYLDGPGDNHIWDAAEYIKVEVPGGIDNGLSSVAVADHLTSGGTRGSDGVADRVYAGDLNGNMWVFDLREIDTADDDADDVEFFKLFEAESAGGVSQSITSAPLLATNSANDNTRGGADILVMFGTGSYISQLDLSRREAQTYYAVSDSDGANANRYLTRSRLAQRIPNTGNGWRTFDTDLDNDGEDDSWVEIDWASSYVDGGQYGWRVELPDGQSGTYSAERVVSRSAKINNLLFFSTIIPDFAECNNSGGKGWLMGVDFRTGLPPSDFRVFPESGEGVNAIADVGVGGVSIDGMPSSPTLTPTEAIVTDEDGEIHKEKIDPGSPSISGRQGWEEIIFQ